MPTTASSNSAPEEHAAPSAADLLLAEFIHRSANDFAVASAEINIASRERSLAAVHQRLEITAARLNALASIQRILQPPRAATVDLGSALCDLCARQAEARFVDREAFIRLRTCEALVDAGRGLAFLMIVSELLTNAARHAFSRPGGLVQIDMTRTGDNILCRIADNGDGMPSHATVKRSGTRIVASLARLSDIEFVMVPGETGSRFELSFCCSGSSTPVARSL